jgi:hypothetical protein
MGKLEKKFQPLVQAKSVGRIMPSRNFIGNFASHALHHHATQNEKCCKHEPKIEVGDQEVDIVSEKSEPPQEVFFNKGQEYHKNVIQQSCFSSEPMLGLDNFNAIIKSYERHQCARKLLAVWKTLEPLDLSSIDCAQAGRFDHWKNMKKDYDVEIKVLDYGNMIYHGEVERKQKQYALGVHESEIVLSVCPNYEIKAGTFDHIKAMPKITNVVNGMYPQGAGRMTYHGISGAWILESTWNKG